MKDYNALFLEIVGEYGLDRSDFTNEEYDQAIVELQNEDAGILTEDGILDSTSIVRRIEKKEGQSI